MKKFVKLIMLLVTFGLSVNVYAATDSPSGTTSVDTEQRDANSTVRFPHASATHYRQILNASCSVAFLVRHRARYKTGGKGFLCSAPRETRHVG